MAITKLGNELFNMNREEFRNLVGTKPKEFRKSKFSKNTTDDFGNLHAFYTKDNKLDSIEYFGNKKDKFSRVKRLLSKVDPNLRSDRAGIISDRYGVAVAGGNDPSDRVESLVYTRPSDPN